MDLTLIRGDTEQIKVMLTKNGEPYKPNDVKDGDLLTLTIRKYVELLKKQIELPNNIFELKHEDTKNLPAGELEYDIEYRKPDNSIVKTLVKGKVKIIKDVTYDSH